MNDHPEQDPLADLTDAGVAVWLDDLSRELLASGGLQSLVDTRHVVGVTTNPTIFASALSNGDRYNKQLDGLAALNTDVDTAVFTVTTDDVGAACDILAPVHVRTAGLDGCVSIEVDPRLSHDATATAETARLLWTTVNRDNLYIKIPATQEGLAAITEVTSQGISVNVTLIFSLERVPRRHGRLPQRPGTGLRRKPARDLTFDQVSGLVLRLPGGHRGRRAP